MQTAKKTSVGGGKISFLEGGDKGTQFSDRYIDPCILLGLPPERAPRRRVPYVILLPAPSHGAERLLSSSIRLCLSCPEQSGQTGG
jgi:hypothetical protein